MRAQRMMSLSQSLAGAALCTVLLASGFGCPGTANEPAPSTGETVSFSARIQPIFDENCIVCHQVGGLADREGIRLRLTDGDSYDLLVNQPSTQQPDLTIVVPGDSAASLLFQKVSSDEPPVGSRMPLGGAPLSSADVRSILDWIDQGALDN